MTKGKAANANTVCDKRHAQAKEQEREGRLIRRVLVTQVRADEHKFSDLICMHVCIGVAVRQSQPGPKYAVGSPHYKLKYGWQEGLLCTGM